MIYRLKELVIDPAAFNKRHQNDLGCLQIGGDKCDVFASSAYGEPTGENEVDYVVTLSDVAVVTTLAHLEDMTGDALKEAVVELARDTIDFCLASIGSDTFIPSKKHRWPTGPETRLD